MGGDTPDYLSPGQGARQRTLSSALLMRIPLEIPRIPARGLLVPCNPLLNNYYYCSLFIARLNSGKS